MTWLGFVDVFLEMSWARVDVPHDRRRRLRAFSRYDETPRCQLIELTADGLDYVVCQDETRPEFEENWDRLRLVLEDASGKRTRRQLLAEWPEDFRAPADSTLYRLLEQAVERGLVCRDGTGRSREPFRYWLPDKEEAWKKDPMYQFEMEQEKFLRSLDDDPLLRDILGRKGGC